MTIFPEYQDVTLDNKFVKGQIPFYILFHQLTQNCRLHHHNFAELSLVVEGDGVEIVNGRMHIVRPGTVTFLLPNHMHEIQSDPNSPIVLYCCMFDLNVLFTMVNDQTLGNTLLKTDKELPAHYDVDGKTLDRLKQLMFEIMEEYTASRLRRDTLIVCKLHEALILILRFHAENGWVSDIQPYKSQNPIWDIIQYVHVHYNEPLTLASVSKNINWNPTYLCRTFSQQTGQTFINYLHAFRIDRAASLLVTTEMTISDISLDVGFKHFRTFSRVFKELKGISPSEYRKSV